MVQLIDLNNCNNVIQLLHESRSCSGQVMTIYKNCILVSMNFFEHFIFPANKEIELIVFQENKLYLCKSIVLGTKSNKNYINLVLSPPEIIKTIERRRYHRTSTNLKTSYLSLDTSVHFHLMSEIPTNILANYEYSSGIINDISGGGLKLQCSDDLEIGSQIVVCMNLKSSVSLLSKIVRKEVISEFEERTYFYGINFDIITEKEREKIIEFVFRNDLNLKKIKGSL